MSNILGIIPARLLSTRLPRKPLADICGKTLIQRVYESCRKSILVSDFIVATDSKEIYDHVFDFGGKAELTKTEHLTGTLRMIEVALKHPEYSSVINVQGDQIGLQAGHIDNVAEKLLRTSYSLITPIIKINESMKSDIQDPNAVKVVMDVNKNALYFSRSPIPFVQGLTMSEWASTGSFYKHLGIYGFKSSILNVISSLKASDLEKHESLEQLTWLKAQINIHLVEVYSDVISVDVPEDLEKARNFINVN